MQYRYRAKITNYVDGDTIDAEVDLGFRILARLRFRLLDVDTPERGKPGFAEATNQLRSLVDQVKDVDGYVEIESRKTGKYGRWLGSIYGLPDAPSINNQLAEWLRLHGLEK